MKTLTRVEIRDMLPLEIPAELERLEATIPIECVEVGQIRRFIAEGFITAQEIRDENGRSSHMLGWHLAPDGTFWVDLLISLARPMPFERIEKVVTGLALSKGAKCLRCSTVRSGMAKWAQAAGWKAEMVVLTKVL
jgi:hypothetical protein